MQKPDHKIQKIKHAFGSDLEQARASNGIISGRWIEFASDVFSKWPLDTAECEDSDDKFQDETARNPSISQSSLVGITLFAPEATDTERWQRLHWRIRPRTFSEPAAWRLNNSQTLRHGKDGG